MTRIAQPLRLICLTAALSLPAAVFAQGSPATGDEAINAINSNFARMTPGPRTVDSINQELRQNHAAPVGGSGGGMRGRGRGRQRSQDGAADGTNGGTSSGANGAATGGASQDGGGLRTSLPGTAGTGAAPAATQ
ncbi:hypothetical protein [Cupriavidus basilensis]|uniref:hypothetical protein n=1 Tax=Cupriavidus basilensis TaxID=68895 RepID=UPI000751A27A|nr:hypothetical protein [Cupriavidus basilensis]